MREALRYLQNAKEILEKVPVEDKVYTDIKPVREALGTAYLALLEAINEVLIKKGYTKKELPKSIDEYRRLLRKHFSVHDGKLLREFESLYDALHWGWMNLLRKAGVKIKRCRAVDFPILKSDLLARKIYFNLLVTVLVDMKLPKGDNKKLNYSLKSRG